MPNIFHAPIRSTGFFVYKINKIASTFEFGKNADSIYVCIVTVLNVKFV